MEIAWILLSVFAALMQAIRTAAQKTLNQTMSTMGTTYVRSLAGLPFIVAFLVLVLYAYGGGVPQISTIYLIYCFAGALAQVLATALLIRMFTLRSFAVGTMLTKTDILLTAIIGSAFFSEQISPSGWVALTIVSIGVLLMLVGKLGGAREIVHGERFSDVIFGSAVRVALLCALMFTGSYLFIREATLLIESGGFLWRGTWTLVIVITMQVVFLGAWLGFKEPGVFTQLWPNRRIIGFIGFTSALGSVGWFSAFALQNASYVRAVGQVEALFTLAISTLYFREKSTRLELLGMAAMLVGVLMFRVVK